MLSYTNMHSKDGIAELKLIAVETIRDSLGDSEWEFIRTDQDMDFPSLHATIGCVRNGNPDIVMGFQAAPVSMGTMRELVSNMVAYLAWNKEFVSGDVDLIDYTTFLLQHRGYKDAAPLEATDRIHFREIDAQRWFAGQGWQHATYYTADERKNARFLQFVMSDLNGLIPGEEGYSGIKQIMLSAEPFGKADKVTTPVSAERARYLN
ncbi:hypothetical protein MZD04_gp370 [Pseudomonas phage Psa21]|uniref:Uncharacterized protein n=1 Tax=Pseudomonas phage Psa21 TaxID=2530023 RepID=A0A481W4Y3_9CAUD|nr:hypothetical protein MZD04_gp370 [Pseudomonas phage Psa21]QBJ02896.1 hypothetical protein PSA21_370 [Pseudomonas phage Psa21]